MAVADETGDGRPDGVASDVCVNSLGVVSCGTVGVLGDGDGTYQSAIPSLLVNNTSPLPSSEFNIHVCQKRGEAEPASPVSQATTESAPVLAVVLKRQTSIPFRFSPVRWNGPPTSCGTTVTCCATATRKQWCCRGSSADGRPW